MISVIILNIGIVHKWTDDDTKYTKSYRSSTWQIDQTSSAGNMINTSTIFPCVPVCVSWLGKKLGSGGNTAESKKRIEIGDPLTSFR